MRVAAVVMAIGVGLAGLGEAGRAAAAEVAASVAVDAGQVLGPVRPLVFGVNTASWDEQLFPGTGEDWPLRFDQDAVRKVKQAGIRFLRYPGGNDGDRYVFNASVNSALRMDTDEFILFCRLVGAEPSISVNYPAGPQLAAEWVRYANVEKGYGVRYWEVGDEEYFSVPAETYARRVVEFARAMKAVDPSVRVGAGVSVAREAWTQEVLRTAGPVLDFVVYNWFPQEPRREDDAALLASPARLRRDLQRLREMIRAAVPERADRIEIHIGGYNSVTGYPGPQTVSIVNALWTADVLGVLLEEGVEAAGYWALHNPYPPRGGDYGLLSATPDNRPNPSYHAFTLFTRHFGSRLVQARSHDPALSAYAATDDGAEALWVVLINKDPDRARRVSLAVQGFDPAPWGLGWLLDREHALAPIVPRPRPAQGVLVPPYSAVSLKLTARRAAAGPQPLPVAVASASSSAELGPAWGPASAVDGDMGTRWASRIFRDEPEWLMLDLGEPARVSGLRLAWERYARRYRVELSQDGQHWETAFETQEGAGGLETVTFEARTARYVRIQMLERAPGLDTSQGYSTWTPGAYSLWEVTVLGSLDGPAGR